MADKLAHLVVEGNTYDIQDEELTNKFDGMTIELSLSNDYVITATLKDGNNTILNTSTIDLPIENSIVSLGYDTTTNEIIGIYRDDTVSVPHRIRVALSNLQEKLTAGQNISITNNVVSVLGLGESSTGTVTGIATLDSYGKVPSSQLPSYVDDVLEYSTLQDFPETGETGKIYIAKDTNITYRWDGSSYVVIGSDLALGETASTAYRGDRGKTAYDHAIAKGSAYQSGLYKITTNSEGHVTNATAVQKSDITALGIPAQDTSYNSGVATEIDNNNNVNVKYDSDTLEVDSQNRLKVKSPSQTFNFNEAIENVNGTVNVRYKGGKWNIGRDSQTNQLTINGKFVKQVEDLDAYTNAPDGEIVQYIGDTDESYTNGYFYKFHQGSSIAEYETITIPANKTYITYHFPDGTEETGYEFSDERYEISGQWMRNLNINVNSSDNGTYLDGDKWKVFLPISRAGDLITYDNQYIGQIESIIVEVINPNAALANYIQIYNYSATIECSSLQNAIDIYKTLCDEHNLVYSPYDNTYFKVKGINVINDNKHYQITTGNSSSGIGEGHALQLISLTGKILLLESDNDLTYKVATEIREGDMIFLFNDGTTESGMENNIYYYNNPHYNEPTTATRGTTTEPITLTVPILYNEDGTLKDIEMTPSTWQRIDVQPTPNGVVMCKMSDGIVYDSYITYTKVKQYLPDYPYYSDDLNWVAGGNPPIQASITDGDYYLDVDTNHIFVADENLELVDVTSSVVIQGDSNKLYCNIDDNKLYRYDGTNFVMVGGGGVTSYNDLTNKPLSVENSKVKYTLSDGTTKLTLAQEDDFVAKAGDTMTGTLILSRTQDASGTANNKPALIVGGTDTQAHIEIDANEIIAKASGTTGTKLWLQDGNGDIGLKGTDYSVQNPDKFRTAIGAGTSNLALGTTGTTAAAGNHTHNLTLATDTGTSSITLALGSKYKLTAGGKTLIFTMPAKPSYTASDVGAMSSTVNTSSSVTWYNSRSGSVAITKIGRVVVGYIGLNSSSTSLSVGSIICSLPYTPSQSIYFPVQNSSSDNALMRIDANSAYIKAATANLGSNISWYGMFVYIATS